MLEKKQQYLTTQFMYSDKRSSALRLKSVVLEPRRERFQAALRSQKWRLSYLKKFFFLVNVLKFARGYMSEIVWFEVVLE